MEAYLDLINSESQSLGALGQRGLELCACVLLEGVSEGDGCVPVSLGELACNDVLDLFGIEKLSFWPLIKFPFLKHGLRKIVNLRILTLKQFQRQMLLISIRGGVIDLDPQFELRLRHWVINRRPSQTAEHNEWSDQKCQHHCGKAIPAKQLGDPVRLITEAFAVVIHVVIFGDEKVRRILEQLTRLPDV